MRYLWSPANYSILWRGLQDIYEGASYLGVEYKWFVAAISFNYLQYLDITRSKYSIRFSSPLPSRIIRYPGEISNLVLSSLFSFWFSLSPYEQYFDDDDYNKKMEESFCFESEAWRKTIQYSVPMKSIFRQSDSLFIATLNEIRIGKLSEEAERVLGDVTNRRDYMQSLFIYDGILPTVLYSRVCIHPSIYVPLFSSLPFFFFNLWIIPCLSLLLSL